MPIVIPILLLGIGVGTVVALALAGADRPVPVHEPEEVEPEVATRNGYDTRWGRDEKGKIKVYPLVDKLLPGLTRASAASGIPLGVLVGWIARESGGRIGEVTRLDERGIFQLHPDESKSLKLDHQRLSTDLNYSLEAGIALIKKYMGLATKMDAAPPGSEYFWKLVKLAHTMGSGITPKIVAMAKDAGEARTWQRLRDYSLANEKKILSTMKHSPTKWMPFIDKIFNTGRPFGVGSSTEVVVGGEVFHDIVDPLDALRG